MRSPFTPATPLYAVCGLSGMCVMAMGASAGFLLDTWRGLGAGLVLGVGVFLFGMKATVMLCSLQTRQTLRTLTKGDPRGEAAAHLALHAVALYQAAVFPLQPGGVSGDEQAFRRAVAYRCAAREDLPRPVRVAAAEALDVIEQGQDVKRAQAAVWTVNEAVRGCRPGFISLSGDPST
ncbi:hypothetical protein [Streptomyces sp. NPDC048489]|uniref:hypothetical protein n=1 Tax=Streptomyces sp. NPDC048489 TaxID=3154504 RepID=UPI00342784CD